MPLNVSSSSFVGLIDSGKTSVSPLALAIFSEIEKPLTIDGWYKRGYEGLKLPTLKKLSNYFGISLDYWADDNLIEPIPPKINNFTQAH